MMFSYRKIMIRINKLTIYKNKNFNLSSVDEIMKSIITVSYHKVHVFLFLKAFQGYTMDGHHNWVNFSLY